MGFEGPIINKLNGGLGRTNPPGDASFGLVISNPDALPSGISAGQVAKLWSIKDAEALGITPSYDSTNKMLAHYHIDEFFRLAPDAELFVLFAGNKNQNEICTMTLGASTIHDLILSEEAARKIKYVAIVHNPDDEYEADTEDDNIDSTVMLAIPKAQAIIDDLFANKIFIDGIMLDGRSFGIDALTSAPNLRLLNAGQVSVCVACDPLIRGLDIAYIGHSAIGSALGMLAVRQVNENLGSVDIKNKPAVKKGRRDYPLGNGIVWSTAILSGGKKVSTLTESQQKNLTNLGYVFAGSYEGYAGIFFNSSPTCVEKASDYAYIENNRTWNKSARIIRQVLIPKMKSTLKKDPSGNISASSAAGMEAIVNSALKVQMVDEDECSAAGCYINPAQSVSEENPLKVMVSIQVDDIIHSMEVDLGLTTQIS